MYAYIENQVDNIMKSLRNELEKSNIVDIKTGKVLLPLQFEKTVKSKIQELQKLEHLVVDINGVATNRYGTNIWMNAMSQLQNMLKYKSLNPQMDRLLKIPDMADKKIQQTPTINKIFRKIFGSKTK